MYKANTTTDKANITTDKANVHSSLLSVEEAEKQKPPGTEM